MRSPEQALRRAVDTGLGFDDAAETEAASRWALAEIDRLRELIVDHRNELDRAALHGLARDRDDVDNALYNAAGVAALSTNEE